MYCEFYGFREKPFNITPNPRFIFLSKNHREAFAHLLYGIDNHGGFIELTGEVGTGKTTVLRTLFEQLDERGLRTALIFNPCLSAQELLRSINREFGIPWEGLTNAELLDELNRFLLAENRAGRTAVLVIDEAQNLEPQVLEQVRLISNLETKTDKLIQIVLSGQPELRLLLSRPELRQFAQRITVSYHLLPMDFEDTTAYIEHRLEVAGDWRAATFAPRALKRLFRYTRGLPRLINIVCDRALLFGYIEESREISGWMVKAAIAEITREGTRTPGTILRKAVPWAMAVAGLAGALALLLPIPGKQPRVQATTKVATVPGNAQIVLPPLDLSRELGGTLESESAVTAFNTLARKWNVPPLAATTQFKRPLRLEKLAARRGLRIARYNGSLGFLVRLGYPALLEFSFPGRAGKRYLALTGMDQGSFRVAPPVAGRPSLSSAELERFWSGIAYIPWKNFNNVPVTPPLVVQGAGAAPLQRLLQDAQAYHGPISGVYDRQTIAAVTKFQESHGLDPNGVVKADTLLLLYRAGGKFPLPTLDTKGGH